MQVEVRTSEKTTGITMKHILKPLGFLLLLLLAACIKEDKFGLSEFKEIKAFEIPGQASATTINAAERTVVIPFDEGEDVTARTPSNIEISNMAKISPGAGQAQDFSQPVIYTVTAEDGSRAEWVVSAAVAAPEPQLPNSNFDFWYDAGGINNQEKVRKAPFGIPPMPDWPLWADSTHLLRTWEAGILLHG